MSFVPKDTATANDHKTAVKVAGDGSEFLDQLFPDFYAVRGDADTSAQKYLQRQDRLVIRRYLTMVTIFAHLVLALMLLFMVQNDDYNITHYLYPWLWLGAMLSAIVPVLIAYGEIHSDDPEISAVVFENLTPEDRDGLFRVWDQSPQLYRPALDELEQRYLQERKNNSTKEKAEASHKQQQAQADAARIMTGASAAKAKSQPSMSERDYLRNLDGTQWPAVTGQIWDANASRFATPWEKLSHHDQVAVYKLLTRSETSTGYFQQQNT